MRDQASLRLYPGRFVGIRFPWNPEMVERIKSLPMRVWDAQSKTWWFPEDYLSLVEGWCIEFDIISVADARRLRGNMLPGATGPRNPYEVLCLMPNAPRGLVEVAYKFWKRQFESAGGLGMRLAEVEEAYRTLSGND